MKKIVLILLFTLAFVGCSEEKIAVEPKIVIGKSLESMKLKDQFGELKTIHSDTKKVIFAFSKNTGHMCNDFFNTKEPTFLTDNHVIFVADVSSAPSLIRSMFIIPGLKDFKHTVLVIEDKTVSINYKHADKAEDIMVVYLDNFIIKNIKYISNKEALAKEF